jgi:uncharacterized protein
VIDLVRLDRVLPQPWRNGGGSTRELLAWPSAADWAVRISVAEIARDGPFSAFPGVERWFAVIQGHGVLLRFAGQRKALSVDGDPLHFDGADAPDCQLQGGTTLDLNLMARKDAGRGKMQRATPDEEWFSSAPLRALFCTGAARLQIDDADAARLPAMALAWSAHAAHQRWRVVDDGGPSGAFWIAFQPRSA